MIWDTWSALYFRYFGKEVPVAPTDAQKGRDAWLHWVSALTEKEAIRLCETVAEKSGGRMSAPPLSAFISTARVIIRDRPGAKNLTATQMELVQDEALVKTPLFNFNVPGYPKRRQAFQCELPKEFTDEIRKITDAFIKGNLVKSEMERLISLAFQPRWEDYTAEEQTELAKKWGIALESARPASKTSSTEPLPCER